MQCEFAKVLQKNPTTHTTTFRSYEDHQEESTCINLGVHYSNFYLFMAVFIIHTHKEGEWRQFLLCQGYLFMLFAIALLLIPTQTSYT